MCRLLGPRSIILFPQRMPPLANHLLATYFLRGSGVDACHAWRGLPPGYSLTPRFEGSDSVGIITVEFVLPW